MTDPVSSSSLPPVPSSQPFLQGMFTSVIWIQWFILLREKVNIINSLVSALGSITGTGFISTDAVTGTVATRTLQEGTGITITNADGVAGDPVISSSGGTSIWADSSLILDGVSVNPVLGTPVEDHMWWRRVGDSMEVRLDFEQSAGGTGGTGDYLFTVPDGQSIDSAKAVFYTGSVTAPRIVGSGIISDQATYSFAIWVVPYDATHLRTYETTSGYIGSTNKNVTATKWTCSFTITIPIDGW